MSLTEAKNHLQQPKTKRAKRALEKKAPKFIENPKSQIVLRGTKTSPIVNDILKDIHKLKQPFSVILFRRLEKRPFEDLTSIEFLGEKNDASLFVFGSHSKKRPHSLTFGRQFDFTMLDLYEFGVNPLTYKPIDYFTKMGDADSAEPQSKGFRYGSKPALLFQGEAFNNDIQLKSLRNFFLDYFRGDEIRKINLMGLDRILVFTAVSPQTDNINDASSMGISVNGVTIFVRHYAVEYQQSSNAKIPYVHLREIGPSMDLQLRRDEHGSEEMQQKARTRSNMSRKPVQKNIRHNELGERTGKLYINRKDQDLSKLATKTKHMKALRRVAKGTQKPSKKNKKKKKGQ